MRDADVGAFYALLDDVGALLQRPGQVMSPTAKAMFFRAMAAYDLATVRAALDAHVKDPQRGRFMPLPADLIAQIQGAAADDGRPGAEEAWAIAMRAQDEADTVVWTEEIAQARSIAQPVLDAGDEVGARMAFREAYGRLVDEARHARRRLAWSVSLGFDPQRRRVALEAAAAAGRISLADVQLLGAPATQEMLLLGMRAASGGAPPEVVEKLRELVSRWRSRADEPSTDVQARAETQRLQDETAARVDDYTRSAP
jgi:hypothetical protein